MKSDVFKQQLEALSAEYRATLPGKLARVDALWQGLSSGEADAGASADLLRELHTLAGSAKTFGLAAVSSTARTAEVFFEPFCAAGAIGPVADRETFSSLLDALRQSVAG